MREVTASRIRNRHMRTEPGIDIYKRGARKSAVTERVLDSKKPAVKMSMRVLENPL